MSKPRNVRKPTLLAALSALLFLECVALIGVAIYLLIELLIARPDSYASAVALLVLTVLAAVWLGVMAAHTLRGKSWIRGAAIVWQVIQFAIGLGSLQGGLFAKPAIGWALIVPAVLVIVLLFTPSVVAATRRAEPEA